METATLSRVSEAPGRPFAQVLILSRLTYQERPTSRRLSRSTRPSSWHFTVDSSIHAHPSDVKSRSWSSPGKFVTCSSLRFLLTTDLGCLNRSSSARFTLSGSWRGRAFAGLSAFSRVGRAGPFLRRSSRTLEGGRLVWTERCRSRGSSCSLNFMGF